MPASGVIDSAMIAAAIDMLRHIFRLDDVGLPTEFLSQIPRIVLHGVKMGGLIRRLQMSEFQIAGDIMFGDPAFHPLDRAISQIENRLAPFPPKLGVDLLHRPPQSWD